MNETYTILVGIYIFSSLLLLIGNIIDDCKQYKWDLANPSFASLTYGDIIRSLIFPFFPVINTLICLGVAFVVILDSLDQFWNTKLVKFK